MDYFSPTLTIKVPSVFAVLRNHLCPEIDAVKIILPREVILLRKSNILASTMLRASFFVQVATWISSNGCGRRDALGTPESAGRRHRADTWGS